MRYKWKFHLNTSYQLDFALSPHTGLEITRELYGTVNSCATCSKFCLHLKILEEFY